MRFGSVIIIVLLFAITASLNLGVFALEYSHPSPDEMHYERADVSVFRVTETPEATPEGAGNDKAAVSIPIGVALALISGFSVCLLCLPSLRHSRTVSELLHGNAHAPREQHEQERDERESDSLWTVYPITEVVHLDQSAVCSICLEPLRNGTSVASLRCGHLFHCDCITSWFEQEVRGRTLACPVCRLEAIARTPVPNV